MSSPTATLLTLNFSLYHDQGVTNYEAIWIGWPGMWVKPGKEREVVTGLLKEQGYVPVWIDPTLLDLYYNG